MNPLYMYEGNLREFGVDCYFPRYDYKEVDACLIYLKINGKYNIPNIIITLAKDGLIRILDISDKTVELFIWRLNNCLRFKTAM